MDRLKLVEYLNSIVVLEKECYEQEEILDWLDWKCDEARNPVMKSREKCVSAPDLCDYISFPGLMLDLAIKNPVLEGSANMLPWVGLVIGGLCFVVGLLFSLPNVRMFGIGFFLFCLIPYIIRIIAGFILFSKAKSNHKKEQIQILRNNIIIGKQNDKIKSQSNACYNRYNMERNNVERKYKETVSLLQKYYDLGIIYPKYRNFVCVASILEYFLSGRCTSLTGHEGAYNILEQDMRFGAILTKLDIVIESLEEIKSNQNMLYTAIQECNASIGRTERMIENSANQIISNQSTVQSQLASIEYTNRVNSRNTQFLKNLAIYDHLTKK